MNDSTLPAEGVDRADARGLLLRMEREGWKFDFFQGVWLLERLLSPESFVGHLGPPAREKLRFRPHLSMGFPASDIRNVARSMNEDGATAHYLVDSTFLGMYGVSTPLPLHYSVRVVKDVQRRESIPDPAADPLPGGEATDPYFARSPLRDFLDLFHHRLLSLFYRAWTKYRYDVSFGISGRDALTPFLLWGIGVPPDTSNEDLAEIDPIRLIRYAGILTHHPRSAAELQGMLTDYFDLLPVRVRQFHERHVAIPADHLCAMGAANSTLGTDCMVGEEVFDMAGALDIAVGPVDWATYLSFLPVGRRFQEAKALTKLCCQDMLAFGLTLILKAGEAPESRLSSQSDAARLGYTTWIRTRELPETSVSFPAQV